MGIIAVTGASGFVGSHLVRLLCDRGERVRILLRSQFKPEILNNLELETVTGDLRNRSSLEKFVEGASTLYHVAADYRLWSDNPQELYDSNVDGTRNILEAARSADVSRVVYTSTVGCLGIPNDGTPGDESTPVSLEDMVGHYKRSKFLAERVALDFADNDLPVVIVNPSTPIGPGDIKPTPTGKVIVDFANGRIPAFVDTGLNLIDVRDTAMGHILACEKGIVGQKYILGNTNLSLAEILSILAGICDKPAPSVRIPYSIAYMAGMFSTSWANVITHRPPGISLESVRMSRKRMFFSARKAVQELGLPQSPIEQALTDAVKWFVDNGYVSGHRARL